MQINNSNITCCKKGGTPIIFLAEILYQSAVTHVDSAGCPLSKNANVFTFHFVSKK